LKSDGRLTHLDKNTAAANYFAAAVFF